MKTVHLADRDAYGRNCIRNGSHGWTMEADQTTPPAEPIRHAQGRSAPDRCAPRRQRVAVFEPDGLPVADAAPGVRSLAHGPPLLSYLATGWNVAEDSRCPPPESPGPSRPKTQPFRGDHRQPVGEDRGKRGRAATMPARRSRVASGTLS